MSHCPLKYCPPALLHSAARKRRAHFSPFPRPRLPLAPDSVHSGSQPHQLRGNCSCQSQPLLSFFLNLIINPWFYLAGLSAAFDTNITTPSSWKHSVHWLPGHVFPSSWLFMSDVALRIFPHLPSRPPGSLPVSVNDNLLSSCSDWKSRSLLDSSHFPKLCL